MTIVYYDGSTLECSEIEVCGNELICDGYREPNDQEKKALAAWEEITKTEEYQQRAYTDAMTDGSSTYWQRKKFFTDRGLEYLLGHDEVRGLRLDRNKMYDGEKAFIRDGNIKGEVQLKYSIRVA